MKELNASVASLTFIARFFRQEAFNIQYIWNAFAKVMTDSNAVLRYRDDSWEQDWFLAKYAAEAPGIGLSAQYLPPREFHAFPMFEVESCVDQITKATGLTFKQSRAPLKVSALFNEQDFGPPILPSVLEEFHDLKGRIRVQGDPAMTELNQILAWLHLALGHLFVGIALTPIESNIQEILQVCDQRWSLVWEQKDLYEELMTVPELIQWKLDVFYGADLRNVGLDMRPSRQGQSQQWREDWTWLSADADPELALAAVKKAAQIMISIPICFFLQQKFREADTSVTTDHLLAAIVFRRWVLQLQAMAWLETALQHSWRHVRAQDLATFAFSALRPHWPRRIFGLSHKSADVKATLSAMRAWSNFRYSIDATSIPHWETNVATVWGLFSTTPALIRVPSEHYEDSDWCLRERELFEYLRDREDFLGGRFLIELPQPHLDALDVVIPTVAGDKDYRVFKPGQFPLLTPVFTLFPFEPWENRLLACAAIVRQIFFRLHDADFTTGACLQLASGSAPPPTFEPLTNHPNGWSSVMRLFADFQREWGDGTDEFALTVLPEAYSPEEVLGEIDSFNIFDLNDGLFDEADVWAAYEWERKILPAVIGDNRYGSFFAIDYRGLTEEIWAREERFMVIRGVNRIRTSIPFWFLQGEGQRVDKWKGMGVNPVFTHYVDGQWDWMWELLADPAWPAEFQKDSKLRFSEKLSAACAATRERGNAYYQGKIR